MVNVLAVVAVWVLVELCVDDIETGRVAVLSEVLSLGESSLEEFSLFSTVSIYMCFLPRAEIRGAEIRGAEIRGAEIRGAEIRGAEIQGSGDTGERRYRGAEIQGAGL